MAQADDRTESARIRTILEITAFDLANLEYILIDNGYIPDSTEEHRIRDATYYYYKASTSQPHLFHISQGCYNIFEPYPYGGVPHYNPNNVAAAMADKNERESVKYDAVMDLIRMLATWKAGEGKDDLPKVKIEQNTERMLKTLREQLEAEKRKNEDVGN